MKYIEVTIHTEPNNIDPLTCVLMDMGIAGFVVSDPGDVDELLNKEHEYDWDYVSEDVLRLREEKAGVTFYLEDDETGCRLLDRLKTMAAGRSAAAGSAATTTAGSAVNADAKSPAAAAATEARAVTEARAAIEASGRPGADGGFCGLPADASFELSFRRADDSEWKDNWKAYFKPARISDRIVVKPTWESYERNGDELIIEIDPGMAFGTGTHPTTSLCVKLLEKYIESPEDVVLDVGCGSGILSIASALLGVKKTVGVEIDPVAVDVARENVERNRLADRVEVLRGDLTKGLDLKADIVVANLMADLVMMLSADVAKHLRGKSVYISSGILIEKQEQVAGAIRDCGFRILEILEEGEWCAIAAAL